MKYVMVATVMLTAFLAGDMLGSRRTMRTAEEKGVVQRLNMDGRPVWLW